MAIDMKTKVREIEKIPGILDIIKKHTGQVLAPGMFKMGAFMSLQAAGKALGWTKEQLQACIDDVNKII